ncbi:MAG: hypothetical protein PUK76_04100 [Treponema sp.]|nr:hypothetical protein [Treponema sp.]MDY5684592.1 hypothetical protein [Treponema sp.]
MENGLSNFMVLGICDFCGKNVASLPKHLRQIEVVPEAVRSTVSA